MQRQHSSAIADRRADTVRPTATVHGLPPAGRPGCATGLRRLLRAAAARRRVLVSSCALALALAGCATPTPPTGEAGSQPAAAPEAAAGTEGTGAQQEQAASETGGEGAARSRETAPAEAETERPAAGGRKTSPIALVSSVPTGAADSARSDKATRSLGKSLAPDEIGYYMDVQEARLREKLGTSPVSIERGGKAILLSLPNEALLSTSSSGDTLSPQGEQWLESLTAVLDEFRLTLLTLADRPGAQPAAGSAADASAAMTVAQGLLDQGLAGARLGVLEHAQGRFVDVGGVPAVTLRIDPLARQ